MNKNKYRDMFVQEAQEHIQNLNHTLLELEKKPNVKEHLDSLFRSVHTIKGMAATMDYDQFTELCKAIEEIFDKLRNSKIKLTSNLTDSLFRCFDILEKMANDENISINLDSYLQSLIDFSKTTSDTQPEEPSALKYPTIRTNMDDLDMLVNLVGELVISKMQLEQTLSRVQTEDIHQSLIALGRVITYLQEHTMKIRLVSVEQIFNRFPRMVRDLSKKQGKEVNITMEGLEIKLDRSVLDAITEPLLHILRNAVDHGIERPEERKRKEKPKSGNIVLTASRIGDKVEIQIKDDGKGLDIDRIKAVAINKKILTSEQAKSITDDEVISLLGTSGLSETTHVTDVSGRGVGFNVVKNQVEAVGGQVRIETTKNLGTIITLTLPLSLAIIGGLLVMVSNEKLVLPLSSISTIIEPDVTEIKSINGKETILVDDTIIPLIRLANVLGISSNNEGKKIIVVVIRKNGKQYGLVVDSFERKQDIVVKRLDISNQFTGFSNATILPDGSVALILDFGLIK